MSQHLADSENNDGSRLSIGWRTWALLALGLCLLVLLFWPSEQSSTLPPPPEIIPSQDTLVRQPVPVIEPRDQPQDSLNPMREPQAPEQPAVESIESQPLAKAIPSGSMPVAQEAVPKLDSSDDFMVAWLLDHSGYDQLPPWIIPESMLRKFVVVVHNLSQGKLVYKHSPVVPPQSPLVVHEQEDERYSLSTQNYERYSNYLRFLTAIPPAHGAQIYRRFETSLQQAYADIGFGRKRFTETLLESVERFLGDTNQPVGSELVRPSVMYRFVDPVAESLSGPQKLLVRIGPDHSQALKNWLTEFRSALLRS